MPCEENLALTNPDKFYSINKRALTRIEPITHANYH